MSLGGDRGARGERDRYRGALGEPGGVTAPGVDKLEHIELERIELDHELEHGELEHGLLPGGGEEAAAGGRVGWHPLALSIADGGGRREQPHRSLDASSSGDADARGGAVGIGRAREAPGGVTGLGAAAAGSLGCRRRRQRRLVHWAVWASAVVVGVLASAASYALCGMWVERGRLLRFDMPRTP